MRPAVHTPSLGTTIGVCRAAESRWVAIAPIAAIIPGEEISDLLTQRVPLDDGQPYCLL